MKREIPLLIAFVSGLLMIMAFFIPTPFFKSLEVLMSNWVQIVTAFAIFLALFSLIRIHGEKISRMEDGYVYSVVLLATLFISTASGIFYGVTDYYPDYVVLEPAQASELATIATDWAKLQTTEQRETFLHEKGAAVNAMLGTSRWVTIAKNLDEVNAAVKSANEAKKAVFPPREDGKYAGKVVLKVSYYNIFQWLYEYVYTPLQATMFSLLAFYMASAAFRAFRARTIEGTLLLGAAFLVMIGRVSFGYWLNQKFCWLPLPAIQEWIMDVPTTAGQRAVMIGAALGVVSASLRMLLGLEQTYLGGE